ncbi:MAG: hypothetical protein ACPLTR_10150 [Thermacetogeniaceae bacterium]
MFVLKAFPISTGVAAEEKVLGVYASRKNAEESLKSLQSRVGRAISMPGGFAFPGPGGWWGAGVFRQAGRR